MGPSQPVGNPALVVAAATCPTGTSRVTDVPITITGAGLTFVRPRGGGCPTRPVYRVAYTKASPMPVMVCFDPEADMCEMMLENEHVKIDLTPALAAAGATAAVPAP
ncbi:MAG: hypothetical protein R3B06_01165 [Kofleriaceae bacterium]